MAPRLRPRREVQLDAFFDPEWYAWQHPDVAPDAGLEHFLGVGSLRLWDPSPLVDFRKLVDAWRAHDDPRSAYERLCIRGAGPAEGVYRSAADLVDSQERFRNAIGPGLLARRAESEERRSHLVFLQNRQSPFLAEWMAHPQRTFDLWVNFYDPAHFDPQVGDWVSVQAGTKFTAIDSFFAQQTDAFASYEYVWLLDDDIHLTWQQIDTAFHVAQLTGADLAQPSLSHDSHCMWPALFSRPGTRWRAVSTVEIMMPIYSQRLALSVFPEFRRSISGFGLDLLGGRRATELGGRAIVIDDVVARHVQQIDQAAGAYYQFLRRGGINANAELWLLAKEFDLPLGITELSASSP